MILNRAYIYLKEALSPGGTIRRFKAWLASILIIEVVFCLCPFIPGHQYGVAGQVMFYFSLLLSISSLLITNHRANKILIHVFPIWGLTLSTLGIITGMSNLGLIIYILAWSMCVLLAERREYFKFMHIVGYLIFMMATLSCAVLFNPAGQDPGIEKIITVGSGCILVIINAYLLFIDFDRDKNYYRETRELYDNLETLSQEMSIILTQDTSLEHTLWTVSQRCIPLLKLEDCTIFLYHPEKHKLVRVTGEENETIQTVKYIKPLEIFVGEGVVGKCFESGTPSIIQETRYHTDVLTKTQAGRSELSVPIFSNGKTVGVIDSAHSLKGFFSDRHLQFFQVISSFCGIKITEYNAKKSLKIAQVARAEADHYKELDELKNRFIANISHDLKTPLSLIKAPASQLLKLEHNPKVQTMAGYILKNTEHLLRVVDQLLQLNRIDQGPNEVYPEKIGVHELLHKIGTQYEGLALVKGIDFTVQSEVIEIKSDAFLVEQIIHNLLHNAFRYTQDNGTIRLTAQKNGAEVSIAVSDNGPGISADLKQKVFERFYKANINNHEGTGIGLSLVKEYVKRLHGNIELISNEGEGCIFRFTIPDNNHTGISPLLNDTLEEPAENGKLVMMVIEDHPDLNRFICSCFEDEFNCIASFNGQDGLEAIKKNIPDIIITDLMMPEMDGESFIAEIKNNDQTAHIPIIVLSAKAQLKSKVDLYKIGADNYLIKPFDIDELRAVVEGLLQQRKKLREIFYKNYLAPEQPASAENQPVFLVNAHQFVMKNIDNHQLSISQLAMELGVGRNKLQKEIKSLTGLSPVEFIRSVRLHEAKKLLTNPKLNISEAAYAVGFNNLSYFSRSFKSEFGMLPTEWQLAQN